jgi:hypothetical protein
MTKDKDVESRMEELLRFVEYYLTLGDLSGHDLMISIGTKSPQFTYDIEQVRVPIDTITDFLRVYGDWGIDLVRKQCIENWDEVINSFVCSPKYKTFEKQCKDKTVMWDLLEGILKKKEE